MRKAKLLIGIFLVAVAAVAAFYFLASPSEIDPALVSGTVSGPKDAVDPTSGGQIRRYFGPDGEPLPFLTDTEVEDFLSTAEVISRKRINEGVNGVDKLLLEKNGIRANAAFRDVDIFKRQTGMVDGALSMDFRDNHIFEVAAYRLSRMLGLDNVPPTVVRRIRRRNGTLQLWIEDVFTEKTRLREEKEPPQPYAWRGQVQTMYLFDRLIGNEDRNQGNILVDENWKLWMIDHTRAFRRFNKPVNLEIVVECERDVWERLQQLDQEEVEQALKKVLNKMEIRALFNRRDELIKYLQDRIDRLGEQAVLRR